MRRISEECLEAAEKLLVEHRGQLDALAKALLQHDSLDEGQILEVTGVKPQAIAAAKAADGQLAKTRAT